jgi:hypothetical protein
LEDAIAFLSGEHINNTQQMVCLCAMQKLSKEDYVRFCNHLLILYDQIKVSEHTLEAAIMTPPSFPHNRIIVDNYRDPNVIKLLKNIEEDKKVKKEIKEYVSNILSGKAKKDLESTPDES